MELHSKELHNNAERKEEDVEISTNKRKTHKISPEERQKLIDELSLIPKKDSYFQKHAYPPYERQQVNYKLRLVI